MNIPLSVHEILISRSHAVLGAVLPALERIPLEGAQQVTQGSPAQRVCPFNDRDLVIFIRIAAYVRMLEEQQLEGYLPSYQMEVKRQAVVSDCVELLCRLSARSGRCRTGQDRTCTVVTAL